MPRTAGTLSICQSLSVFVTMSMSMSRSLSLSESMSVSLSQWQMNKNSGNWHAATRFFLLCRQYFYLHSRTGPGTKCRSHFHDKRYCTSIAGSATGTGADAYQSPNLNLHIPQRGGGVYSAYSHSWSTLCQRVVMQPYL
jgi:hypothetical protein